MRTTVRNIALVIAILALLIAIALFIMVIARPTELPTSTPESPSEKQQSQVIFTENFESNNGDKFAIQGGTWAVMDDGTNNRVLNANSMNASWSYAHFSSTFSDGIVEYRVRVTDFDTGPGFAFLIFRDAPEARYQFVISLNGKNAVLYFQGGDDLWTMIAGQNDYQYNFQKGIWYTVRLEANGSKIRAYVNDNLAISVDDSRIKQGGLTLAIGPNTIAQFDDIKTSLFTR